MVESIDLINRFYKRKQKENRSFSIRWLARNLDVSPSLVSLMMRGKRSLNFDLMERLSMLLDMDDEHRQRLLQALLKERGMKEKTPAIDLRMGGSPTVHVTWESVPKNKFDLLKSWHYIAILDCTKLRDYDGSMAFIARKLNLGLMLVTNSFEELKAAELLVFEEGKWIMRSNYIEFSSMVQKDSIRKFHKDQMENAKKNLERTSEADLRRRSISGLTITGNQEQVDIARKKISDFFQELAKDFTNAPAEDVYHLAIQLFPLSE